MDAILTEALTWPAVLGRPSEISVEGARALTLDSTAPEGPAEASMVGREFCHVHAQGDFSLHASCRSHSPRPPSGPGGPNRTSSCARARRRRPS